MKLKFCGLTRKADIEAANEVKPDFIGFRVRGEPPACVG